MFRIKKRTRVLFIILMLINPWVLSISSHLEGYLDIFVFAGIYTLTTIGLSLLMGYAGQISLGHSAFFGIGAYVSGILTVHYQWNPWFCMAAGIIVCAITAAIIGLPTLKLQGHYLAMATMAFGIVIYIVFNEETAFTGGPDGMSGIPSLSFFGFKFDSIISYYYLVWGIVVVAFLFSVNLIQSRLGRALRAIHTSEIAADAMGVDVSLYKLQIFIFSAVLASVSGSLYAHYMNFIAPGSFDISFSILLVIMIVTGGMFSIWGAVLGSILVSFLTFEWLENFKELEVLAFGAILLLITIFLPEGLVSLPDKVISLIRRKSVKKEVKHV